VRVPEGPSPADRDAELRRLRVDNQRLREDNEDLRERLGYTSRMVEELRTRLFDLQDHSRLRTAAPLGPGVELVGAEDLERASHVLRMVKPLTLPAS
jgi:hypothetical protein